jgi:small ligand-binding sensory domain FIST
MTTDDAITPRFAAALSTRADAAAAVQEVCQQALSRSGNTPDLALAFVSQHHAQHFGLVAKMINEQLGAGVLLGCTGEAIVGGCREIEGDPAIAVWVARLPGTTVQPMHLSFERTPEGGTILGWPDDLPESWPAGSALVLLGEPYSFPVDLLLERLNEDQPRIPVVGGMASGGYAPGENKLFLGGDAIDSGAVAVLVSGEVRIRSIVSQGCRPIGRHYVVTKAERNVILELGGQPPLAQLQELFPTLPPRDRELLNSGLHVGRVINEYQDRFQRGDFLVRNVIGADPNSGAIAIGDYVRAGQTVQFHLRDAESADEDLRELLAAAGPAAAAGGLLFTCNGRGTRLFDMPDHDAAVIQSALGKLPLAGFFAQGELGPIGGRNFIHGFTASLVLLEAK